MDGYDILQKQLGERRKAQGSRQKAKGEDGN
jgi:hypothetical protein